MVDSECVFIYREREEAPLLDTGLLTSEQQTAEAEAAGHDRVEQRHSTAHAWFQQV